MTLGEENLEGISPTFKNTQGVDIKRMGPGFLEVTSSRIMGNGHKLQHGKFNMNISKTLLTVRVTEH